MRHAPRLVQVCSWKFNVLQNATLILRMIGSLQLAVSLGRMDIAIAVITISLLFRVVPCQGHLEQVKRIVKYLSKMHHGAG